MSWVCNCYAWKDTKSKSFYLNSYKRHIISGLYHLRYKMKKIKSLLYLYIPWKPFFPHLHTLLSILYFISGLADGSLFWIQRSNITLFCSSKPLRRTLSFLGSLGVSWDILLSTCVAPAWHDTFQVYLSAFQVPNQSLPHTTWFIKLVNHPRPNLTIKSP